MDSAQPQSIFKALIFTKRQLQTQIAVDLTSCEEREVRAAGKVGDHPLSRLYVAPIPWEILLFAFDSGQGVFDVHRRLVTVYCVVRRCVCEIRNTTT